MTPQGYSHLAFAHTQNYAGSHSFCRFQTVRTGMMLASEENDGVRVRQMLAVGGDGCLANKHNPNKVAIQYWTLFEVTKPGKSKLDHPGLPLQASEYLPETRSAEPGRGR